HPFLHLHISNNGTAKACCVANIPFGNINDQSLEEIWNGAAINELREKFRSGKTDKRCAVCHRLEATGGKSIRMETKEKFGHIAIEPIPKLPVYFDIRFSNICNFRCRTCWHGASSKWFSDAKKLGTNIGEKAIIKNIKSLEDFISKTGKALLGAEEFYFAGGEPLVTEEHYLLLEWLIENKATHARLRYNTNFSKLQFKDYDILELWKHFPKVEILASIDATGELGEYIRKDSLWKTILSNREKISVLPHVQFKIAPTISVLNIHHLVNLYQECLQSNMIGPEGLYINILERPNHYNIQILPKEQKEKITLKMLEAMNEETPLSIRRAFQEVMDYMNAEDRSDLWGKYLEKNGRLDQLLGGLKD
ncbi:MAG: twitch domain-containing radical SAM protein, partial [Saprospiraceae bacterium]